VEFIPQSGRFRVFRHGFHEFARIKIRFVPLVPGFGWSLPAEREVTCRSVGGQTWEMGTRVD
jgi:hypothetical protein